MRWRIRCDAAILAFDLKSDLHRIDLRQEIAFGGLEAAALSNQLVAFGAAPNAMTIQPEVWGNRTSFLHRLE